MSEGGALAQPGQSQMSASPEAVPSDPQTTAVQPQAVPVQQAAPIQLQPTPTGATGAGPVTTTPAPPAYGDVVKNQQGQPVQPVQIRPAQPIQYFQPTQLQPGQPVQYFQPGQTMPGQPQMFYAQQPMVHPGGQQAFQYVMAPGPTQPIMVFPRPGYEGPHDFFFLSVIVMTLCAILNLTSIAFGIPALVLSALSRGEKVQGNYLSAQKYASAAVILNVCAIVWTLGLACLAIGLSVGSYYQTCYYMVYDGESTYTC